MNKTILYVVFSLGIIPVGSFLYLLGISDFYAGFFCGFLMGLNMYWFNSTNK